MHKIKRSFARCKLMRAFSLVELSVSLVVVGVLLASLSPVISKKIQGTSVVAGPGASSNGRSFTPDPNDPDCSPAADGSNAVDCKIQIPSGVNMVNVSMLSGGGGGAGATSSTYLTNQTLQGTTSLTIVKGMKNFKITNLKGAGGGGGGANSYQYLANKDTLITSPSFTIPSGMTNVRAQLMGSGGGGGGANVYSYQAEKNVHVTTKVCAPTKLGALTRILCEYKNLTISTTGMNNVRVKMLGSGGTGGRAYNSAAGCISAGGGGGGSGAYLDTTIPNNYLDTNGTIELIATACKISGSEAPKGGSLCPTTIKVKNSLGTMVYGLNIPAAGAGGNASSSSAGLGGSGGSVCQKYISGWTNIACTKNGGNGWAGERKKGYGSGQYCYNTASGGPGGTSKPGYHKSIHEMWYQRADGTEYELGETPLCYGTGASSQASASSGGFSFSSASNICGQYPYINLYYDRTASGSASGGGGGGGAKYHITIPNNYISAGNTILLSAPSCTGGAIGLNGKGGADCLAQLLIKNGSTITYGLQAYAGSGGLGATASSAGIGGTGATSCRRYLGSWSSVSCTANGRAGAGGAIYAGKVNLSGGAGGNGADNNVTGKGGNGGSTTASGAAIGASGAVGYARFYYDRYVPAPVSGGGGGSGAAVANVSIPQSVIDANVGGKIEIKSGAGGSYGAARANGSAGGESYVLVKNSSGKIVWGYKTTGGSGGGAASTTAGGIGGAGGRCQSWKGSSWTNASCSSNGLQGGNGVKSSNGSTVAGGAAKGSGYGASGAGAANVSTNGANGSAGVAQVTYDRYFQAAAGGGGGGGAYAQIKGIKVIPLKIYTVRIGKGGAGGTVGANGQAGGMSRVIFDSAVHAVSGGASGSAGKGAGLSALVQHGAGGAYGRITTNAIGVTYTNGKNGSAGTSSGFNSIGGNGAASGIGTKGACGGLFTNPSICQNTSINGTALTFKLPRNINKTPTPGSAGAAGAGGGWNNANQNQSGKGSAGLDGYLHIWWQTYK